MKFDHILFPIDFSEQCNGLNKQVEWLAGRFGSRVTLLHVFEIPATWYAGYGSEAMYVNPECFEPIKDGAKRRVREYSINVPEERIERFVAEGDAAGHITQWTSENDVDLIIMGTHGYGKLRGLLLGSVTAKVLHDVSCPVWTNALANLTEDSPAPGVSSILCALELTDEAVPLLQFTQELAKNFGAKVRVVHSVPKMEARPDKYFDFDLHRYLTESARVEISKRLREAGTDFPLTISHGRIANGVAEVARNEGADLIVVGRGKCQEPFGRLRTHTYGIIREAPCPVLSYAVGQPVRVSSSYSEVRLDQYAIDGRLLTGSLTP